MPRDANDSGTIEMERALLAALCQSHTADANRAELLKSLPSYQWKSGDCRAIYEALTTRPDEPVDIRRDLAARLTRIGFPDVDFDFCFEPAGFSVESALQWLREQGNPPQPARISPAATTRHS